MSLIWSRDIIIKHFRTTSKVFQVFVERRILCFYYVAIWFKFQRVYIYTIFTKTVRQLVKHWRKSSIKVAVYLDDGFGVEVSYELCVKHARRIKADLIASGFVPNKDKCVWLPSQHVEWLGFSWNLISCKLQIPQRKIDDILNLVAFILNSSYRVKVRQLAKICGKLIALTPAVGNVTQIMTRNIFSVINIRDYWDQYVNIGKYPDCINELIFWRDNLPLLKAVDLVKNISNFHIFTDASDTGAAGFIQNSTKILHKMWLETERGRSSTWREVKAIQLCVSAFSKLLQNSIVTFHTDNKNAVSIINKGSKVQELQQLSLEIYRCCLLENITLHIIWLPRKENEQADLLSRIIDIDDWGISSEYFQFLDDLWGPHTFDRFANMDNNKVDKFSSLYWNPGSSAVDAFSCHWAQENNLLVPPVSLVCKCINHLVRCKAEGTLIVPSWPSSPYWPLIFDENTEYRSYVLDVLEFNEVDRILVSGNNLNSIFANGKFKGRILAVRLKATD